MAPVSLTGRRLSGARQREGVAPVSLTGRRLSGARQREGVAPVSLTGRRLTVWSKTERRCGTCKFNWEEANCVVQDREKVWHL